MKRRGSLLMNIDSTRHGPVTNARWNFKSYLNRAPKHIRGMAVIRQLDVESFTGFL
jgi:hypothetical protein